jgi:hypothetical protein
MQREAVIMRNIIEIDKNIMKVRLMAAFCEVYFCVSAARVCSGNLTIPANEQMRYSSRFEAFCHVPSFASQPYIKYIEDSQFLKFIEFPATICYQKAAEAAKLCCDILTMLQQLHPNDSGIKAKLDLAKRNRIACNLLSSKPEIFDTLDFEKNFLFPLIVIKNQTTQKQ